MEARSNGPAMRRRTMPTMIRFSARVLSIGVGIVTMSGCSTSFWYTAVQGAAYERCESIQDADERARCKNANFPDEEKFRTERASTGTR